MPDRNLIPNIVPLSEPVLLPYQCFKLNNGIEVIYIQDPSQNVFKMDVIFEAGVYYQSQPLLASTAINMLNEGTRLHSAEEIADIFDFYGAYTDFYCGLNKSELSLISLCKYARETITMLVEMLTESVIPDKGNDARKSSTGTPRYPRRATPFRSVLPATTFRFGRIAVRSIAF